MTTRVLTMRRFHRGEWRSVTAPIDLLVEDEIIGTFTPAGWQEADKPVRLARPSAPPTPKVAPVPVPEPTPAVVLTAAERSLLEQRMIHR